MITKTRKENEIHEAEGQWTTLMTLGGKSKTFLWKTDESFSIHISREFKNAEAKTISIISAQELDQLNEYMKDNEWVDLANNVEKLGDRTEKNGIGKFLHENMEWQTSDAQLASQLSAIFSFSGAWDFNGMKRGMKFKKSDKDWRECVKSMYKKLISDAV